REEPGIAAGAPTGHAFARGRSTQGASRLDERQPRRPGPCPRRRDAEDPPGQLPRAGRPRGRLSRHGRNDVRMRRSEGRRVAITGMGCLTPIGSGYAAFARGVKEARSGVGRISLFDPEGLPVTIAAEVRDFDPTEQLPPRELRHVARVVPLALAAAAEAFAR